MPIAQLLELWKKIEVEPMEIEVSPEKESVVLFLQSPENPNSAASGQSVYYKEIIFIERRLCGRVWGV